MKELQALLQLLDVYWHAVEETIHCSVCNIAVKSPGNQC